jgi:hypothetical protein
VILCLWSAYSLASARSVSRDSLKLAFSPIGNQSLSRHSHSRRSIQSLRFVKYFVCHFAVAVLFYSWFSFCSQASEEGSRERVRVGKFLTSFLCSLRFCLIASGRHLLRSPSHQWLARKHLRQLPSLPQSTELPAPATASTSQQIRGPALATVGSQHFRLRCCCCHCEGGSYSGICRGGQSGL